MRGARLAVELVLAAAVAAFAWLYWQEIHSRPAVGETVVAKQAPEVAKIDKEVVSVPHVVAYKPEAKKKLNLPADVQADKSVAVTSATKVKPDIRPVIVTTAINAETGETTAYETRQPLPLAAIDTRGEAGIILGYRSGEPAVRLEARQALFDIKAVKFGVVGSYDQPLGGGKPDAMIGFGAWYRW